MNSGRTSGRRSRLDGRRRSRRLPILIDVDAASLGLAVLVGGVLGVLIGRAARPSSRGAGCVRCPSPRPGRRAPLPSALSRQTTDALEAMRSAWLVVDGDDRVAAASSSAAVLGLVRGHRVALEALLRAVRAARGSGERGRAAHRAAVAARAPRARPSWRPGSHRWTAGWWRCIVDDRSEARRVDDVRRDFVANVSHELKTPVGALSLLAEAVEDASDDPEAVRRFAGRMHHEAARLATLVNELIDLSRLQGDDPLSHAEVIAVDDLVTVAVDRGRLHAEAKQITLAVGGEHGLSVFGDRKQLVDRPEQPGRQRDQLQPATRTKVALSARAARRRGRDRRHRPGDRDPRGATSTGSSSASTGSTRPARGRPAAPGSGCRSSSTSAANHGGEVVVWSAEGAGSTFTLRLPRHGADRAPVDGRRRPGPAEPAPSTREAAR